MNENVINLEECRKQFQQGSFEALRSLDRSPLQLVDEDEPREVPVEPADCQWNNQPRPPESKRKVYILVCLPLVLTIAYMLLADGLGLW